MPGKLMPPFIKDALSRRIRAVDQELEIQALLERPAPLLVAERTELMAQIDAGEAAIRTKLAPTEVAFLASREPYFGRISSSQAPEALQTHLHHERFARENVGMANDEANRARVRLVASYTKVVEGGAAAIAQAEAEVATALVQLAEATQTPAIEIVSVNPQA